MRACVCEYVYVACVHAHARTLVFVCMRASVCMYMCVDVYDVFTSSMLQNIQ